MSASGLTRSSRKPQTRTERHIVQLKPIGRMRPVYRETCQEQVYSTLRMALMKGQFMPGDVVTLRGIAEELGTSLTPVREALRQLMAEQALEVVEHRKVRVPTPNREKLEEMRRVRVLLEGMLTEQASARMDRGTLAKLDELMADMDVALDRVDAKRYLARNQTFHFEIYHTAQSPVTLRMVENLWLGIGPTFNLLLWNGTLPHLAGTTLDKRKFLSEHHRAIVQAMREKRHANARKAMEADISGGMRFLIGAV